MIALLIGAYWWHSTRPVIYAPPTPTDTPSPFLIQPTSPRAPYFFPIPAPSRNWTLGPTGPTLSEAFARSVLKLQPPQIERVNKILQTIYAEFLALEARNTERRTDSAGHVVVTIKPLTGPITALEARLWSELDAIFDAQQQRLARLNLELDPPVFSKMRGAKRSPYPSWSNRVSSGGGRMVPESSCGGSARGITGRYSREDLSTRKVLPSFRQSIAASGMKRRRANPTDPGYPASFRHSLLGQRRIGPTELGHRQEDRRLWIWTQPRR